MKNTACVFSTAILLVAITAVAPAQEKPQGPPLAQGRGNRPIVLGPDDVRAFPDAPAGFNTRRADVPAGRIEPFEYDSRVTGTRRKANVYLPPGYSSDKKYPVLYLLHGIGGDETEWIRFATPDALFDNLIAAKGPAFRWEVGKAKAKLKLLYLSCGNKDGLINISQGVHVYLKERGVPHIWNVDEEGHTPKTWASDLYHFAQRMFR